MTWRRIMLLTVLSVAVWVLLIVFVVARCSSR